MKLQVINKTLVYQNNTIAIDDLYNDEFYKYSDYKSHLFHNDTYGVNELYINIVQHYLALEFFITTHKVSEVDILKADRILSLYIKDICINKNIKCIGFNRCDTVKITVMYSVYTILTSIYLIYLMLKIPYEHHQIEPAENFSVLRHKGAIKKFKQFDFIDQEIEDLYNKQSIYRLFRFRTRLKWIFKAYINVYVTKKQINSFYLSSLGKWSCYAIDSFYSKRIVYAEFYKLMLDTYFSYHRNKSFYTGNNLDRFSVIEDCTAKKYNIKTFNIPHGIEYGFKFPKGFSSDIFYTHTLYTAEYLNSLYCTNKFVFNKDIIQTMFDYKYNQPHEQMIIYFTEPREVEVNLSIISELVPKVKAMGKILYLKLHPGDKIYNYKDLDVEFIHDYELALTGNICIARKSTILIEAIYNRSIPIAIITNPKDNSTFNLFPSLRTDDIIRTYSVDQLFSVIQTNTVD